MQEQFDVLSMVRTAAAKRMLFLPHALRQMLWPDRMISVAEVRRVLTEGRVIEDYPEDARGLSCLMLGFGDANRPIHVVCSPKDDYVAVITAYVPDAGAWSADFRVRIKK
jgi:hypothetical protein